MALLPSRAGRAGDAHTPREATLTHAIGIDAGSTNVKVALVDDEGRLVASASRALTFRRDGDVAEQDADVLWAAVVDAVRETTVQAPGAAADVRTIGVCSQYSSIVPVDADVRALAPMTLYWDQRGTAPSWAILERHPDAFEVFVERHGIPPVGGGLSLGHVLRFQAEEPDVHAAAAAYLEPMDFLTARLTHRITATQCTMFMVQVCDNRKVGVTDYDDELVRRSGIDPSRLPPLVPVDGVAGELHADVAATLGLPAGVAVQAGMNDSQAGAFAAGVFQPGRGGLAIGTTAVLLEAVDDRRLDLDAQLVSMPSPVPGRYLVWAENGIAGKAIEHVLEHVVYASDPLADHLTDDHFSSLDPALASTPPGSNGVLFLPHLAGSLAPSHDGNARGAFLNLSLDSRRVDLVRAMVEGTAHNVAWLLPAVERFTGRAIDEVAFFGGAARSREWAQILADVLNRPVGTLPQPEIAVARATALVALSRTGVTGALDDAARIEHLYEPRKMLRDLYDAMQEQFVAAFDALRPVHAALHDPTFEANLAGAPAALADEGTAP